MSAERPTITDALDQLAQKFGATPDVPAEAYPAGSPEELIVRYTLGSGKFVMVGGGPRIVVKGDMYKLDGTPDGSWEGIDDPLTIANVAKSFSAPPEPEPPFDEPKPTVNRVDTLSYSKGIFRFGDGSSIEAIGPANIRVIYYVDGSAQLWITGDQIITTGTGRYAGAQGLKTVGGSTWVPKEKAVDLTQAGEFSAKTIEVFRVVRAQYIEGGPS
ncbi:MAG TPA: hypothetical protein VFV34_02715 [Blastocatellia bacterium]|nr:hypothetical protein [Blastocatellia bacterium]